MFAYYALHHGSYSLLDRQQAAVFVWVGIGVAAICGILPAVKPPRVLLVPLLAILAMAAWTLLSLTWTESAERTFAEFARMIGYLGVVVLVWLGVGRSTWRLVAAGLLSAGVLVCLLTLLSRIWPAIFPSDTVAINLKTTRVNYPFGYWNAVGCWSAMTVTLSLAYAAHARSALIRGLALAVIPACAAGLFLAVSRAGFGGAILGAAVVIVFAQNRWLTFIQALLAGCASAILMVVIHQHRAIELGRGTDGAADVVVAAGVGGVLLFAVAYFAARSELGSKLRMRREVGRPLGVIGVVFAALVLTIGLYSEGGRAYDQFTGRSLVVVGKESPNRLAQLNGNRHNLWASGWRAFESQPLHGIGPGTFEFWWSRDGANGEFVRDVHNIYLEALAETGVVGLSALLAFFVGLLWCAWVSRQKLRLAGGDGVGIQAGLVAVFAVFMLQAATDWMWESTAVAVFALGSIAIATSAASLPRRRGGDNAMNSVGILVLAALAVVLMLPGLSNQRQIDKSQAAFRAGDNAAALAAASKAVNAESWSATAYGQKALALENAGDLEGASTAISRARALEPTNWRWPLIAVSIDTARGDGAAAVRDLRQARALRRYSKFFGQASPVIR